MSVIRIALSAACLAAALPGQTRINLESQSRNVNFQAAPYTKPAKAGVLLPGTCTEGELFFLTAALPGANVYGCTAANTWTPESGALTIQNNGTTLATRNIVNFVPGSGILDLLVDSGSQINVQQAVDSAVVITRAGHQAGQTVLCQSTGGTPGVFSCEMSPTLTMYTTGMMVNWIPDVTTNGGAVSLNIDLLGAKSVTLADGSSDPGVQDLIGGRMYQIWYDGAKFRFLR